MIKFVSVINELMKSKMKIDMSDIVVNVICNAIMIVSYIPEPSAAAIVERMNVDRKINDGKVTGDGGPDAGILSWDHLTDEHIAANTHQYEKFNKLILNLAFGCVESIYGCFQLIIDRYRK